MIDKPAPAASFKEIATAYGRGGVLASLVGPGPTPGSQRLYQSYIYAGDTVELVSVNPQTGDFKVFPSPVKTEYGAWGMVAGPDGNIYLGTLPRAHILRLDPRTGVLSDMGRPSPTEEYIWQLTVGADGKLYGCTYPSARLVRFDPRTEKGEDLGRMDETENYARSIAASKDGFIYIGIGFGKAHLAAYEIATGQHRDILPATYQVTGAAEVYQGADGHPYGQANGQHFRLEGWKAAPIPLAEAAARAPQHRLADGRMVQAEGEVVRVSGETTSVNPQSPAPASQSPTGNPHSPVRHPPSEHPFTYRGRALAIFRLGWGPDGMLYASTILPLYLLRIPPGGGEPDNLGLLGGGELYSLLNHDGRLLMAAYSGKAPLMSYNPGAAFHPGETPGSNPVLVHYTGQEGSWRPQAMIAGPGGKVYIGAVSAYGKLGGPLAVWDTQTNTVESYPQLVEDQSVVSLVMAGDLLVGGTTVEGGGGSHPTQKDARLFLWDPRTHQKLFETVPVPGAGSITDLVAAPDGMVFGIAGGSTLFVFDPAARKVIHTSPLPFRGVIYNAITVGPGGLLWGLSSQGIFTIDPRTYNTALVAKSPEPITAGIAIQGSTIYYASGAKVWRYGG